MILLIVLPPHQYSRACEFGLEGFASNHRDRPYQGGKSKHWINRVKVKNRKHHAFARVQEAHSRWGLDPLSFLPGESR